MGLNQSIVADDSEPLHQVGYWLNRLSYLGGGSPWHVPQRFFVITSARTKL